VSPNSASTNLNRTNSSSGDLAMAAAGVSYQDLCFPKTSNYGSMKKKKNRALVTTQHVGVECRLASVVPTAPYYA